MKNRLCPNVVVFLLFVIAAALALSAPALAAENAKTTKYGVDLYEQPSFKSKIIARMTYERRVEVIVQMNLNDTFEGDTAPWYRVSTGLGEGFVFGKYLAIDAGVTVPVYSNATITGDGVRVRGIPSTLGRDIVSVLSKGARIEVIAKTEFVDTIDGLTAPWYRISYMEWVFGAFVKVDEGIDVPLVSFEWKEDGIAMIAFVLKGYAAFGETKAEIKKKLGEPISETRKKSTCSDLPDSFFYTLVYKDVVFRGVDGDWGDFLYSVTYVTGAYDFYGLKVGSSVAEVERALGDGHRDTVYNSKEEALFYSGEKYGFVGWNGLEFTIGTDDTISAIRFWSGEINCGEDEIW